MTLVDDSYYTLCGFSLLVLALGLINFEAATYLPGAQLASSRYALA
jgi:hypothetical protein